MLRKWGTIVLLLLITPMLALAQNTGKISGVVTDGENGDPLPGASVAIVGTQQGTITDVNGEYFIIGVPVGAYDVQASFVGYQTVTSSGVEVNSGYTLELNFTLDPGVELGEIVVEYERPLIQKDAIGVPKIVSGEDIVNLPVRGATNVAAIQAGVVSKEGSDELNVRGGRGEEVTYYVDGVKVIGGAAVGGAVPQSAIQEQEMIIGNISARYGDAMSGVINITTKSGGREFFGSVEGITSEALDDFGYNLASAAIGGPLGTDRLGFFVAAEYLGQLDGAPSAIGEFRLSDGQLDELRTNPVVLQGVNADGNAVYLPVTGGLESGARLNSQHVLDDGSVVPVNGQLTFSDGTTVNVPDGVGISSLDLLEAAAVLTADDFQDKQAKRANETQRFSVDGNLNFNLAESIRLRVGGRYIDSQDQSNGGGSLANRNNLFAPENYRNLDRQTYQVFATWTQYLSNSTFYQLQFDYSDRAGTNYDNAFSNNVEDILFYADIDHSSNSVLRGYKNVSFVKETRIDQHGTPDDTSDDTTFDVDVPVYTNRYSDGVMPLTETIARLVTPPGGITNTFSQFHNQQMRFTATATTQIGLHQIEFGGEFEKRTQRFWSISQGGVNRLARWFADGDPEALETGEAGFSSYGSIPFQPFEASINSYGYSYNGLSETDTESIANYTGAQGTGCENALTAAKSCFDTAPWEPIYYGGYIQDKIEFRDIVLNLGVRVDVYDNNSRVLLDPFSRLPLERAGSGGPANIESNYAVYYLGNDVAGYRDLDGNFYDAAGNEVQAGEILLAGAKPRQTSNTVTDAVFEDYEPQVTVMPRIGVSFPVTDQALFFARYGVVSQRPSTNAFEAISGLASATGRINNNALQPEEIIEYELGFRQRVGARSAMTLSGFFRQIKNLIQLEDRRQAFPQGFSTFSNFDFGTVKGIELDYDLRRTRGFALNANYTISFAQGTGSDANSTSTIVWIDETPPNFISPLDFDQRHQLNLSLDYRLGEGEGPTIFGGKLLENAGVNVLMTAGSGLPYTPQVEPFSVIESKAAVPSGGINGDRMDWTSRIDLRIDRRFPLGGKANLSAFVWVQNLLDQDNFFNVWRFTGLPDEDGFLATNGGEQFLGGQTSAAETLYNHRNRRVDYFGIPRLTRIGVRLDF